MAYARGMLDAHDRAQVPRRRVRPRPRPVRRDDGGGFLGGLVGGIADKAVDIVRSPIDVMRLGTRRDSPSRFLPERVASPRNVRTATHIIAEQTGVAALDRIRRGRATPADYLVLAGLGVGSINPLLRAFGGRKGQAMTTSPYIQGPLGDFLRDLGEAKMRYERLQRQREEQRRRRDR